MQMTRPAAHSSFIRRLGAVAIVLTDAESEVAHARSVADNGGVLIRFAPGDAT
jgi:hypothetical protein